MKHLSRHRQKEKADTDKDTGRSGTRKAQHVVTVIVTITFDSEQLSCPVREKRQINIVIHNFRLNSLLLLPLCSFLGHSICRNSDKRIPIDCWWDQRINKWNGFCFFIFFLPPPSLCFILQNGQRVKQWSKAHKKTAVINKHNKTLI